MTSAKGFIERYKNMPHPDLSAIGWSERAIDDAAKTYNQTGKFPTNLGNRQYAGIISGTIRDRAAEMLQQENKKTEDRSRDWQTYKAQQYGLNRYMGGPQSNTITSLNVVVAHLETLRELSHALQNGDYRVFNEVAQRWAEQTGQPPPTNFEQARHIVGPEVIKAIGIAGAGTGTERQAAIAFDRATSPQAMDGAIDTIDQLLVGQLRGRRQQFKVATGQPDSVFDEFLLPETKVYFDRAESAHRGGVAPGAAQITPQRAPKRACL
jgi:hypothetical protein